MHDLGQSLHTYTEVNVYQILTHKCQYTHTTQTWTDSLAYHFSHNVLGQRL